MNHEDAVVIVTEPKRRHLMTVQEYADWCRIHPRTVYRLISENKQPGVVRVGRHLRIDPEVSKESVTA